MREAYHQRRHDAATSAHGYLQYNMEIRGDDSISLDRARVGSIQFNGNIITGHIHWATADETDEERDCLKYHTTRVINHFVRARNFNDYIIAREQARNFREHFLNKLEE